MHTPRTGTQIAYPLPLSAATAFRGSVTKQLPAVTLPLESWTPVASTMEGHRASWRLVHFDEGDADAAILSGNDGRVGSGTQARE